MTGGRATRLDGTEVFLLPLVAALSPTIRSVIVSYPVSGAEGYGDVLEVVRRAAAEFSEFYVLGLSFSGPLAVMLAAEEPKRVKGVILAATFIRVPRPALKRLRLACNGPMLWMWRIFRRVPIIDVSSALRRCKQPILCISFRGDRVVPYRNVEDIMREAPSATHAAIPGGHFTGCTNSGLLAAEVEQFLARVEVRR